MNYRHSFHAGNFADLVKHALVLWLVKEVRPSVVLDTHAGAGLYDLSGDAARSKEAEAGVARLMSAEGRPPLIDALAERVAGFNPDGGVRFYPGSPLLIADALEQGGRYVGFELNPPVRQMLSEALQGRANAEAREGDGYALAVAEAAKARGPLVLIDPPFEKPDDYARAAETAIAVVRRDPKATVAIWTPLKDLETFDAFIRRLQGRAGPTLVAEARLRPLTNPMKMNGCAMVVVNPPQGGEAAADEICGWAARALGDAGGRAEVWTF
ncbi:Ribosomal RNA large subunit methyltransferase J [Brevundimonas sp. SH203]|uniref:23S rRNA (adenine(2030)-N(6))-methyltransferase RlmJ n=1 Tax=Brevundimonas sp. SH203 TaxID=345167 RepID=UPI0009CE00DF|nr:23S rRNA (adenine(2030)-N(6))-methyltransferase RlmJ [Brevundimonas sp. SH203]GAW42499.1 Ribosomal RNA large subunit methyltransferase J [Brevundimonas sp. SH203]